MLLVSAALISCKPASKPSKPADTAQSQTTKTEAKKAVAEKAAEAKTAESKVAESNTQEASHSETTTQHSSEDNTLVKTQDEYADAVKSLSPGDEIAVSYTHLTLPTIYSV